MTGQRFKVKTCILAIIEVDGQRATVYVPEGDIVTIVGGPLNGTRLAEVTWNGRTALMFTIDLCERAVLLQAASSAA